MARMVPAREGWKWVRKIVQTRRTLCTTPPPNNNKQPMNRNNEKVVVDGGSSSFRDLDAYKNLDKLDFKSAAKILFTTPPKNKKFGIDFHLVQLFFVCMPSLAVYLVAQYARYEIRRMEAELEVKKKAEAEKAKEMELVAAEEKETESDSKLLEVKVRLDKLEETVKEIAVHSKKQPVSSTTENQEDGVDRKHFIASDPNNSQHRSQASNFAPKDNLSQQNSAEVTPGFGQEKVNGLAQVTDASRQDQNGKSPDRGPSQD